MTRRLMIIAVYVIAATILLLSGICLFGLNTENIHALPTPSEARKEPTTSPTQPPTSTSDLTIYEREARLIVLPEEDVSRVLSWKSDDESVVTVDSGGRIDGISAGETRIFATLSDNRQDVYNVTVREAKAVGKANRHSTAITAHGDILEKNLISNYRNPYSIDVNREQNIVTVYTYDSNGDYTVPVRAMICSCGIDKATVTGDYETYFRAEWHALYDNVFGMYTTGIHEDFLFHSVPYEEMMKNNSLETEEFNKLGEEASLGCVRLAVADAKWIYDNCAIGTQVHIYDSDKEEPLGKPDPIRIKDLDICWDPTDDNEENPYNDEVPTITVEKAIELKVGDQFDIFKGVSATDSCGNDITERLQYLGNVTTSRVGTYRVTYRVTDAMHRTTEKTVTSEVK